MYIVYQLQSETHPEKYYVGITIDLERRLLEHNQGKSIHTNKFKPWKIVVYHVFINKEKAAQFEAYLKTGSGRAFSKKHF